MGYEQTEGTFEGVDNARLFFRSFKSNKHKKGFNLVIHHGYGEHSGRYQNVIEIFAGSGVNIYAMDARGHGQSEGLQGHAESIAQMAGDLGAFIEFLVSEHQVSQPVLLAHSMGGLIALHYCLEEKNQQKLKALVANGSALKVHLTSSLKIKLNLGRLLASLAPRLRLSAGLDLKYLSHDQEVIKAYKEDKLVHGNLSTTLGLAIYDGGEYILANAERIKLPVFLTHGEADGLIPASGTAELYNKVASVEKSLKLYPGLYHEVYNESKEVRQEPLNDVRNWVIDALKNY